MKIAYVVSGIKKSVFFENTAFYLKEAGLDVFYILISNESNDFELFLKQQGLPYIVITFKSILFYPVYVGKIFSLLKSYKIELVHTHLTSANITGLVAAKFAGLKFRVYTEHSGEQRRMTWKGKVFNYIIKKTYTQVIATTSNIKQSLINIRKYIPTSIYIVPLGFEIDKIRSPDWNAVKNLKLIYNPQQRYPVIGVISRAVAWKGVQYAIPAFEKLLIKYPNALLLLFNFNNKDAYSANLKKQLTALPPNSYKTIAYENDVYNLYSMFDYFVHVPIDIYSEGFGQTYIEALAAGIPSVFTISGVASDFIINNNNALIANYCDPENIYEKLTSLIEDHCLSKKLIIEGQKSVDRFDFHVYINNLLTFYSFISKKSYE